MTMMCPMRERLVSSAYAGMAEAVPSSALAMLNVPTLLRSFTVVRSAIFGAPDGLVESSIISTQGYSCVTPRLTLRLDHALATILVTQLQSADHALRSELHVG